MQMPARAASSSISRRCRTGGWGAGRTNSSTGWPSPARPGGRCCRSVRPTATALPTRRARRLRRGRGCSRRHGPRFGTRRSWTSVTATASGSPTGSGSPGAAPSRIRCGSNGNGARCARMPLPPECGCSATSRSTSRGGASITSPIRNCSRRVSSPGRHRTRSPQPGSSGVTRCTTGRRCAGGDTGGGSSGCAGRSSSSTWRGSTTSAGSCPTGRCRPGRGPRWRGGGSGGPGEPCSTRRGGRSVPSRRSSPRTSA